MSEEEVKMAQLTYQFMQRVQLQGNEVPNFNAVVNWLAAKAQAQPQPAEEAPSPVKAVPNE